MTDTKKLTELPPPPEPPADLRPVDAIARLSAVPFFDCLKVLLSAGIILEYTGWGGELGAFLEEEAIPELPSYDNVVACKHYVAKVVADVKRYNPSRLTKLDDIKCRTKKG